MCRKVPDEAMVRSSTTSARWSCPAAATTIDLVTKPEKNGNAEIAKAPTM